MLLIIEFCKRDVGSVKQIHLTILRLVLFKNK